MHADGHAVALAQHLVLLVLGLHGQTSDLEFAANAIQRQYGADVVVLISPVCSKGTTRLGIDQLARDLLTFVERRLPSYPNVQFLSMIGYSMGGLVARRLLYLAHRSGLVPDRLTPHSLITVATPHLGTRHLGRVIFGLPLIGIGSIVAQICAGASGQEMFVDDQRRMLVQMTDDDHLNALRLCRNLVTYACAWHDYAVSFVSAAITQCNPYRNGRLKDVDALIDCANLTPSPHRCELDPVEKALWTRLNALNWRRRVFTSARLGMGHLDIVVVNARKPANGGVVIQDIVEQLNLGPGTLRGQN